MYESDDPRSRLATAAGPASASAAFGSSTYARFYDTPPQQDEALHKTWYARGQNFVIAYSDAEAGASFERNGQPDEYVLLLPDEGTAVTVEAKGEKRDIGGFTITMIPPGDSRVTVTAGGRVIRLISTQSVDVAALASNADTYAGPHPQVPPFKPWPRSTSTSPFLILPSLIASSARAVLLKTRAGPSKDSGRLPSRMPSFTTALSGASDPLRMAIDGPAEIGRSSGRMISVSPSGRAARFSAKVLPVQVRALVSMTGARRWCRRPRSCRSTAPRCRSRPEAPAPRGR